jgi:hypothetical protein
MMAAAMNTPTDDVGSTKTPAADQARTNAAGAPTTAPTAVPVVTMLDPVRFFSPLVAAIAFAVSAPALYRALVVQTEPVANALIRVLVSWVIVWSALWVLHLLIGPVSPRQSDASPDGDPS